MKKLLCWQKFKNILFIYMTEFDHFFINRRFVTRRDKAMSTVVRRALAFRRSLGHGATKAFLLRKGCSLAFVEFVLKIPKERRSCRRRQAVLSSYTLTNKIAPELVQAEVRAGLGSGLSE
jgi:uncharacterized membrane protein